MNILIAGVGGQGTLLASRVLGVYAIDNELDCKLSEVHGMAQRGGSVVTYVRIAENKDEKIYSPVIGEGEADIVLAFERLEALRWAHCIKDGGKIMFSSAEIMPMPVVIGKDKYPTDVKEKLKGSIEVNATEIAEKLGNIKVANTVMLGALCKNLNLNKEMFIISLKKCIPEKMIKVNLDAFELGYNF